MNRRHLLSVFARYLSILFAISLAAAGLLYGGPPSWKRAALFFFLLFFLATVLLLWRWINQLKQNLGSLAEAIRNLGEETWDAPLPSSDIEELWETTLTFHAQREVLHDKIVALEGEREKLAGILSNLREGILVSDPGNRILVANESARKLLKAESTELVGNSLDLLLVGPYKPIFESLIHGEEKSETLSVDSQETIFYRSFFLKTSEESLIAKVCVLYDITESKKLEDMRKAFVANASHELRSPAAGLQAILDAFEVGGMEESEQREKFFGMMKREVSRLNAIIGDLLDLSELEREKEFRKKPLALVQLFNEWLLSYQIQLQEKKIEIRRSFREEEYNVEGSEEDIEKLFRNLIENAIKYTPAGGSIEIGLTKEDGDLHGWVGDTGVGIPEEDRDRIFERFYRVDKSRSRALGGTGLGLSIAKHAVERHGGKIWMESKEGQGSTFHFTIPLGTERR